MKKRKTPAIAVLAGGIFWVGLLWGIFLYILSYQKIRNLKSYQNYRSVERIGALASRIHQRGSDDRYRNSSRDCW